MSSVRSRVSSAVNISDLNISDLNFISDVIQNITTVRKYEVPSDYIEAIRYLPPELSPQPGPYSFTHTPYLKEIINQLSPLNDTRKIVFMKPAQIGATVGILENAIAYFIGCMPTSILYVSADKQLVEKGMEVKINQMLESCNLKSKIFSQSQNMSGKKTGDKKDSKEFVGGFLHAAGARSPGKLRQMSYRVILMDELDGFPMTVGKEGDPVALAENRSNAFAKKRKILYLSTPTVAQISKIEPLYKQGDQRKLHTPCPRCRRLICLQWHVKNKNGEDCGIKFKVDENDILIVDSVHYKCQKCGRKIYEREKPQMLKKCRWIPTATTQERGLISYWMDATWSPQGMYGWVDMVYDWLKSWNIKTQKVKNIDQYRSFRNTKQGKSFEEQGESISYERTIAHRRMYHKNTVPNKLAMVEAGSPIVYLTCAVDVQGDGLFVHIVGWAQNGISYTIDFRKLGLSHGDINNFRDNCWLQLRHIIETEVFIADDGAEYRIETTAIDSGWCSNTVYDFCKNYVSGLIAIKGESDLPNGILYTEMTKATRAKIGFNALFKVNTHELKTRISRSLRRNWNEGELQPDFYMNFPADLRDDFFKMFSAEYLAERRDRRTNKFMGYEWKHISSQPNHAFDTSVYNLALIHMLAESICWTRIGLRRLDWAKFWKYGIEKTELKKEIENK